MRDEVDAFWRAVVAYVDGEVRHSFVLVIPELKQ